MFVQNLFLKNNAEQSQQFNKSKMLKVECTDSSFWEK